MSAYSLQLLNAEKYHEDFEANILYSFDQYIYKEHFRVGDGITDEDELEHDLIFYRILCEDNCEIKNYIQDKIEGKLDPIHKKNKAKRRLLDSIEAYSYQEHCNENEATQHIFWENATW